MPPGHGPGARRPLRDAAGAGGGGGALAGGRAGRRLSGPAGRPGGARGEAARGRAHGRLALVRDQLGEREAALAGYERMRLAFTQLAADFPAVPHYRQNLATSHNALGTLLAGLGRWAEAEAQYRRALALQ